jgi:hypothetical protein
MELGTHTGAKTIGGNWKAHHQRSKDVTREMNVNKKGRLRVFPF